MPTPDGLQMLQKSLKSIPAKDLMTKCRAMIPANTTAGAATKLLDNYAQERNALKKQEIAKDIERMLEKMKENTRDLDNEQKEQEGLVLMTLKLLVAMIVASKGANDALAQVSRAHPPSQDLMHYVAKVTPAAGAVTGTAEELDDVIKKYNEFRNDHAKEFENVPEAQMFKSAEELKNDPRFAQYSESLKDAQYPITFFLFPNAQMLNQFQQQTGVRLQSVSTNAERSQQQNQQTSQQYKPNQAQDRQQQSTRNQQQQQQPQQPQQQQQQQPSSATTKQNAAPKPEDLISERLRGADSQTIKKEFKKFLISDHPDKNLNATEKQKTQFVASKATYEKLIGSAKGRESSASSSPSAGPSMGKG